MKSQFSKQTVLVTGGAGFLGSHLCLTLLKRGYAVVCIDDFSTGQKDNLSELYAYSNFKFIEHDCIKPFDVYADYIFHLACPASPIHYQKMPLKTLHTATLGTMNVLELARKCFAKVFIASTSEVYGDPKQHPQDESYWGHVNTIGPRACYDEGKRVSETLAINYYKEYDIPITVGRLFNVYGPKMQTCDGRVVSSFIVSALKEEPITIFGDGNQTRSFCFVTDVIEAFLEIKKTTANFSLYNIGNPYEISISYLANIIKKLTRSSSEIVFKNLPEDDPRQRQPDISLIKKELFWSPKVSLIDGLKTTIDYFSNEKVLETTALCLSLNSSSFT